MKPNKESVARRLKLIRKDLGWTIDMMANNLGLAKGTFNSYLRGLALPPEIIVEKIAKLADVSTEWIYYGDVKDFIEAYLVNKGYKDFLDDYPNTIDEICLAMEKQSHIYSSNEVYPKEVTISDIFDDFYNPIFEEYIKNIVSEFIIEIQNYPLYSDDIEYNSQKYFSRVRSLIHKERPTIKYGEYDRIFKIAEMEFYTRVELYNSQTEDGDIYNESFLDFMIEKLKTYQGTLEVISIITAQKKLSYNINSKESDEIIEVFRSMYEGLKKIKE